MQNKSQGTVQLKKAEIQMETADETRKAENEKDLGILC